MRLRRGIRNLLIILATPQNRSSHRQPPTKNRPSYCTTQCPLHSTFNTTLYHLPWKRMSAKKRDNDTALFTADSHKQQKNNKINSLLSLLVTLSIFNLFE